MTLTFVWAHSGISQSDHPHIGFATQVGPSMKEVLKNSFTNVRLSYSYKVSFKRSTIHNFNLSAHWRSFLNTAGHRKQATQNHFENRSSYSIKPNNIHHS